MYRFRNYKWLIEHKELENQEIYFASLDQLNDPIEGYRETVWDGDEIQWECLFVHYAFCLEWAYSALLVAGESSLIDDAYIPVSTWENNLPTNEYKEIYNELRRIIGNNKNMRELCSILAQQESPVSATELEIYLRFIHVDFLCIISGLLKRRGLCDTELSPKDSTRKKLLNSAVELVKLLNTSSTEQRALKKIEIETLGFANEQMELLQSLGNGTQKPNKDFIILEFPRRYMRKINEIIYPNWYVACFMSECSNSSVWGSYGDFHKGFCLKFKDEISTGIELTNSKGRKIKFTFNEVNYSAYRPTINFFEWIGRLPMPQILGQWMTDSKGNISKCYSKFSSRLESWRGQYHEAFSKICNTKTEDWKFENEFRITIDDMFEDFTDQDMRKFTYNFDDLEGIVFGMQTEKKHKIEIIKLITEKCKKVNRNKFSFYQAKYSPSDGSIKIKKMNLLNV